MCQQATVVVLLLLALHANAALSTAAGIPAGVAALLPPALRVPLLTTAGAAMATQLTTLAALLVRDGGMGEAAASATLASALGLPPQDVWTFDAFGATMFGEPAMQASDMLWLVRQMQVSVTVDCLGRAFAGGDTYSDYTYAGADG